ncbi:unnamed protein product [Paramecium sonneborni]|uniref:Uncharacterized protein n=1 Tax=Paramecium sonneborni TaxID=65129 RepID=A0A8S1RLE4_9CILI|nr:unnamed protein product [Paramecium sonneborni]
MNYGYAKVSSNTIDVLNETFSLKKYKREKEYKQKDESFNYDNQLWDTLSNRIRLQFQKNCVNYEKTLLIKLNKLDSLLLK